MLTFLQYEVHFDFCSPKPKFKFGLFIYPCLSVHCAVYTFRYFHDHKFKQLIRSWVSTRQPEDFKTWMINWKVLKIRYILYKKNMKEFYMDCIWKLKDFSKNAQVCIFIIPYKFSFEKFLEYFNANWSLLYINKGLILTNTSMFA